MNDCRTCGGAYQCYCDDRERFIREHASRLAVAYPEAHRMCITCRKRPPCDHHSVGLQTCWSRAKELWDAKPEDC